MVVVHCIVWLSRRYARARAASCVLKAFKSARGAADELMHDMRILEPRGVMGHWARRRAAFIMYEI